MPNVTHLECTACGAEYDSSQLLNVCTKCGKPIYTRYDLAAASRTLSRESLAGRRSDMPALTTAPLTLSARFCPRSMSAVGIDSYGEYQRYLEAEPDEFVQLFNTVLINVTTFFRDSLPWQYLASEVVPKILEQKRKFDTIRIWSAGCATGEEAYSLAMIFAEALGFDGFRSRVKIYATDVDEEALAAARLGSFEAKHVKNPASTADADTSVRKVPRSALW